MRQKCTGRLQRRRAAVPRYPDDQRQAWRAGVSNVRETNLPGFAVASPHVMLEHHEFVTAVAATVFAGQDIGRQSHAQHRRMERVTIKGDRPVGVADGFAGASAKGQKSNRAAGDKVGYGAHTPREVKASETV